MPSTPPSELVLSERQESVLVVTLNRPQVRNAIDPATARRLAEIFRAFDDDDTLSVAVLTGAQGTFCSGFDLASISQQSDMPDLLQGGDAPLGVTHMQLSKPVIAAVEGYAVAGGLEIALWCDLRVSAENATFGVYNRRWGIPLIDGGTIRLPRLIGQGRALDLILTGRSVPAQEALAMGLVNRLVPNGQALAHALELARELVRLPQHCLRSDRLSAYEQWGMEMPAALRNEASRGQEVLNSGEALRGAQRFASGHGRHGDPKDI
ncbi:crotonase/enoyl-CoA hydratase family protein [Ktedonobacter racemifer]|uniref:Enoyl-CoA hydratase/isomerase n=1 Tax=Ktedonobacter racemifer DSM 44963 TaxID=485913 RepID=D6TTW8_KTERA|nr:crotonase/enoyl-CoA hydratase family protein [Ktedonobacter racemifer]EFH83869.1 Enoyl-CoA hydratase/isomerase [Ktedonobacter racemifer DSM 44963]